MSILRRLGVSITIAGLFLLGAGVVSSFAANPHTIAVTVTNSNSSTPADGTLTMNAYIQVRPGEVITLASPSQQYTGGALLVNLADFSAWAAGEVLVVQLTNTANQEVGTLNVTITNDDPQLANLQLTAGTGTLIVRSNLQAGSYTITGPANFNGNLSDGALSGGYYQKTLSTATPIGSYTVAWGAVAGYFTPANETLNLAKDGSITFTGTYNQIPSYNLTMAVSPVGGGTTVPIAGTTSRLQGSVVNISATPNSGYRWNIWTVSGGVNVDTPSSQNTTVTIDQNKTVTANFTRTYTLTTGWTGNGNVTGTAPGTYDVNDPITLTAIPSEHWRLVNWTVNGNAVSTNLTYNTTLDANKNIIANFEEITFILTVASSPANGGTVNRDPAGTLVAAGQYRYLEGTQVNLTPAAGVGYQFKEWQGGLTGSDIPGVLTLNANATVTAVFEQIPYLSINKTEIVFTDTKLTDTLTITNNGQGLLSWEIEVAQDPPGINPTGQKAPMGAGWLGVSPLNSGDNPLAAGQSAVVTLTVLLNSSYAELTVKNTSAGVTQPNQLVIARINQAPTAPDNEGINFRYLDANAAPVGTAIALEAVGVDTPILIAGPAFNDADENDYQIGREYEIWTQVRNMEGVFEPQGSDFDLKVFGAAIQGDGASVSFGRNILSPDTLYGLRVRYQDNYSAWSEWSEWLQFTTVPAGETRNNLNQGVPSDQFVDLNTVDLEKYPYLAGHTNYETEARVVLATEAATGNLVPVLVETNTGNLVYLRQDNLGSPTASTTAPYGLFTTRVENLAAGGEFTLTFTFPEALPAGMIWYKYDETTADWTPYDEANWDFGPAANQVTVRIKDGGYGDADQVENTVAIDPSGPITLPSGGGFIRDYSGGGGGCFIATAAFGSYQERHVWMLRLFRDRFLLTNRPGRAFVRFYYRHSPSLAGWISGREWARSVTRSLLMPLYGAAYLLVNGLAGLIALAAGLAGLAVLAVRRRRTAVLAAAAGLLLITAGPLAALDANHLVPAAGESAMVRTYTADLVPAGSWQLGGFLNYVNTPLEAKINGVNRALSEEQYILTVSGAYALNEKWQLGGSFPWLVKQEGELTGVDEAVESTAGDIRLEAKYRLRGGKDQLGYALVPFLTLPTGDDDPARGFFGRPSVSGGVIFVADRNWCNHTHVAFNIGLQVQEEEELGRMTIQNTLLFGLGLSRLLQNEKTTLALEINGQADDTWFAEAEATPIEILGSVTQRVNDYLRLSFGLGGSLNDGYGAPDYRVLLGLKAAF